MATGRHRATPTRYRGVIFRSRLEAKWASYFDRRGIAWDYEPVLCREWRPDFVIGLGTERAAVEVKPVSRFPASTAGKIDRSSWRGTALILGETPKHAWIRQGATWRPHPME